MGSGAQGRSPGDSYHMRDVFKAAVSRQVRKTGVGPAGRELHLGVRVRAGRRQGSAEPAGITRTSVQAVFQRARRWGGALRTNLRLR